MTKKKHNFLHLLIEIDHFLLLTIWFSLLLHKTSDAENKFLLFFGQIYRTFLQHYISVCCLSLHLVYV